MKIKWFGFSSFLITSDDGIRIITDPYQHNYQPDDPPEGMDIIRPAITEMADVVTITHGHFDHSYVYTISGIPQLYTGSAPAEIKGIKFSSIVTYHGDNRGLNNIICIEVDGIRVWHLGDLGHKLSDQQLAEVGRVDILLTPWDNNEITMPFDVLTEVLSQLKSKVIFPMHHVVVDDYIESMENFTRMDVSELEFKSYTLPSETRVILLKTAL